MKSLKLMKSLITTLLFCLLVSCSENDMVGKWHCDVVNVGRVTLIFNDDNTLDLVQNGITVGRSTYSITESNNINVLDPDGSRFVLTRNTDGSINFQNSHMHGYFVKE